MKGWWEEIDFGPAGYELQLDERAGFNALRVKAMREGKTFRQNARSGKPLEGKRKERALAALVEMGGAPAAIEVYNSGPRKVYDAKILYVWPEAVAEYSVGGHFTFGSNDPALFDRLCAWGAEWVRPAARARPDGQVFVIVPTMSGYDVASMGRPEAPLERGNYTPDVLAAYDHVVADIAAKAPCGRISVFDGPPGCGKTYMVRALIGDVPDAMCVMVPPQMVAELNGPVFVRTLMNTRRNHGLDDAPIVLVLEDADACLAARKADNMASIATLLNLSDGIVGSLLDLRVVATTNTPEADFDPAMMRPGRLCRRVHVGTLDMETAMGVYFRVVGSNDAARWAEFHALVAAGQDLTLARIYRAAYDAAAPRTTAAA